jgi:hypothetical protein
MEICRGQKLTGGAVVAGRTAIKDAKDRDASQRIDLKHAGNLLKPKEVAGDYSAARLLATTLGGQLRPITSDDLRVFQATVKRLGKKFTGGITAKAVVDMSLRVDRDRANTEIRTAIPVSSKNGIVQFVTNAGPQSNVSRHYVFVEFLNFSAAVASPTKSSTTAKQVTEGRLRYKCDCGRHIFWFSYLCSVGKFVYGDPQINFPKIRNPKLVGVACKHVLRVMQQLSSPIIKAQVEKMIEAGRNNIDSKRRILSKKEAQAMADEQAKRQDWKRNRVESTGERRLRLAQTRAIQAVVARAATPLRGMTARKVETAKKQFETNARKLMAMGVLTQKQLTTMLGKL